MKFTKLTHTMFILYVFCLCSLLIYISLNVLDAKDIAIKWTYIVLKHFNL